MTTNSKITHTPGNWRIQSPKGSLTAWAIESETRHPVAWVAQTIGNHPEEDANARLIASAPELLEALQFVLSRLDGPGQQILYSDALSPDSDDHTVVDYLKAAINKATGKE